uniref:Uncharacterized protein n=1 Tax=Hadrurus spadix TaxID=141984 RepID=A0A1W7RAD8_9SCOR
MWPHSYYVRVCSNCLHLGFLLTGSKITLILLAIYSFISLIDCDTCQFPSEWTGMWFQKGVQRSIRIQNNTISTKGVCKKFEGDKFIIENKMERCYRCLAIYEKHPNVLQYKETYCFRPPDNDVSIEQLCKKINGDALLFSMFRLNTSPVTCPFEGPFTFSYSQGHKECKEPPSTVDACTDDSRLFFRFQACTNVMGSESKTETLHCLATWKEGPRFLVGRFAHKHANTDEEEFRCFVYETVEETGKILVSQSGDATCDGMFSATEGSRTMTLTKVNHPHSPCQFPDWLTSSHHWKTLNGLQTYALSYRNNSYNITAAEKLVTKVICAREDKKTSSYSQYVIHVTSNCDIGYSCLRIHQRAPHVVEMQTGKLVNHEAEACSVFDPVSADFVTLTSVSSEPRECPLVGIYFLEGSQVQLAHYHSPEVVSNPCSEYATLTSGCSMGDRMDLLQECASNKRTLGFHCHGNWEENGTHYVIVSSGGAKNHLCIAYTENEKILQFSGSLEVCPRNIQLGRDGLIALNGTNRGLCQDTNSVSNNHINSVTAFIILLSLLFHCFR